MPISLTLRRNRLIALIAAAAMVVVICGYAYHGMGHDIDHGVGQSCHCDWTAHFTGLSGSAPHPTPLVKPVLASRVMPAPAAAAPHSLRRLRAHLARGPPVPLSIG